MPLINLDWIRHKPYILLWAFFSFFFVLLFFRQDHNIDIQYHDSYYVIAAFHMVLFMAFYLALIGGIYWITKDLERVGWLTILHVILTVITALIAMILLLHSELSGAKYFPENHTHYFDLIR